MNESTRNERLDSLLGAYALDAVTSSERAEIEAYLRDQPRARAEVAEHYEVAALLAQGAPDAPAELWGRIAAALDADAERPTPTGELSKVLRLDTPRRGPSRRSIGRRSLVGLAVAAGAALLFAGLTLATSRGGDDLADGQARYTAVRDAPDSLVSQLRSADDSLRVEVAVDASGNGYLDARPLPRLTSDTTYQLWAIVDSKPLSLGLLGAQPTFVAFNSSNPDAVLAITSEPSTGSTQPTSDPLVLGTLS